MPSVVFSLRFSRLLLQRLLIQLRKILSSFSTASSCARSLCEMNILHCTTGPRNPGRAALQDASASSWFLPPLYYCALTTGPGFVPGKFIESMFSLSPVLLPSIPASPFHIHGPLWPDYKSSYICPLFNQLL